MKNKINGKKIVNSLSANSYDMRKENIGSKKIRQAEKKIVNICKANLLNIEAIKKKIVPILKKHDVVQAGLFGSVVHGKKNPKDVDILIKFKGRKSLFDLVGLGLELEEKLGKKTDLVTYNSLHPLLKEIILNDEVRLYEER